MNSENDYKKTLDAFGDFDIDQIQADIAKDLAGVDIAAPPYIASINQPTAHFFTTLPKPAYLPMTQKDMGHENFYRETIKNTNRSTGSFSHWAKIAGVLLLVFTLGTGTLGFGIGAGFGHFNRPDRQVETPTTPSAEVATITSTTYTFENIVDGQNIGTLADIVELITPSVVSVNSHYYATQPSPARLGSGVIFAETEDRIFIVTSNYIVRGMGRVLVSIDGSQLMDAHPAGNDTTIDMAVVYIYKSQLVAAGIDAIVIATFGDSSQMRVGDTVLAIGNAMGEGNSVTRGVISALETNAMSQVGHALPLLQTDAAINYGNSGGPLINTRGEVIGINLNQMSGAIFGLTSVEGMGYSVSSNIVAPLIDDIINNRRPALGILGGTISTETATRLDIPSIGVYVSGVTEGGSAHRAGMAASDIITGFNGLPVLNWQQLVYAIRASQVGDVVEVRVLRGGTEVLTLQVQLDATVPSGF